VGNKGEENNSPFDHRKISFGDRPSVLRIYQDKKKGQFRRGKVNNTGKKKEKSYTTKRFTKKKCTRRRKQESSECELTLSDRTIRGGERNNQVGGGKTSKEKRRPFSWRCWGNRGTEKKELSVPGA